MSGARHRSGELTHQGAGPRSARRGVIAAVAAVALVLAVGAGWTVWRITNDSADTGQTSAVGPANESAVAGECRNPIELTLAVADSYVDVFAAAVEKLGTEAPCVAAELVPASKVGAGGRAKPADIDAVVEASVGGGENGVTKELKGIPTAAPKTVARTITTVAMPQPMAEAIGWPRERKTWADLTALITDPQAWSTQGRPQFGDFAVSAPDPSTSPAGLAGVLGVASAASGTPIADLSPAKVVSERVQGALLALDRAVTRRAANQPELVESLRDADQSVDLLATTSLALLDEQSVWAFNASKPDVPLVALYPLNGTLPVDLTYAAATAESADEKRSVAAADLGAYLLTDAGQEAVTEVGLRDVADNASPLLTEALGVSPGGTGSMTSAPSADAVAAVSGGWARLQNPGRFLVVMDVSGSMAEDVPGTGRTKLQFAQDAAIQGIRLVPEAAEIGLWEFSTRLEEDRDYRDLIGVGEVGAEVDGQTRRAGLVGAVQGLTPQADTGLYDTALAAFRSAAADYQPGEPNVIVLLTDGRNDDPGSVGLTALVDTLRAEQNKNRPVRFLTIGYGQDADTAALERIAAATGGSAYASPNPADIGKVFFKALTDS